MRMKQSYLPPFTLLFTAFQLLLSRKTVVASEEEDDTSKGSIFSTYAERRGISYTDSDILRNSHIVTAMRRGEYYYPVHSKVDEYALPVRRWNSSWGDDNVIHVDVEEEVGSITRLVQLRSQFARKYCIESVIPAQFEDSFAIDPFSGVLQVTKILDADDPHLGNVVGISVAAYGEENITCRKGPTAAQILRSDVLVIVTVVDINDNSPSFLNFDGKPQSHVFAYPQETSLQRAIGPVGLVQAFDNDVSSILTYSLIGSEDFVIDSKTGHIYLVGKFKCFDEDCEFNVIANDSEHSAILRFKVLSLAMNFIYTLHLDGTDVTKVEAALDGIKQKTGTNVHRLYCVVTVPKEKSAQNWQIHVHVYAEYQERLLTLDEFNRRLKEGGMSWTAARFTDSDVYDTTNDNDKVGCIVAISVLGAAVAIIIIAVVGFIVFKHRKKNKCQLPQKQISTLGRAYANLSFRSHEQAPTTEHTFASIFGDLGDNSCETASIKSITAAKSSSDGPTTPDQNSKY